MRIQAFSSALVVWMLIVVPTSADMKAYHGGICRAVDLHGGDWDLDGYTETYIDFKGFVSLEAEPGVVMCPLIRDRVNSASTLTHVYLEGRNNDGSLDFSCVLYAQDEDPGGDIIDYDTDSASGSGDIQLGPFEVTSSTGAEASYVMECDIDWADSIRHIYVNEGTAGSD